MPKSNSINSATAANVEQIRMGEAMSGDLDFVMGPATPAKTVGAGTSTSRHIQATLVNAAGDCHTWFNVKVPMTLVDTGTPQTASIEGVAHEGAGVYNILFVNGVANITLLRDETGYSDAERTLLTIAAQTILDVTTSAVTSDEVFST